MFQVKAQSAGNGLSFSKAATQDWDIWVTPFGRAGKRSLCTDVPVPRRAGRPIAAVRGVAPLAKDRAIACEARLRQLLPALLYLLHRPPGMEEMQKDCREQSLPCSRAANHFPTR